jgi:hypothetical protein
MSFTYFQCDSCDTSPGISDHHAIVIDSNLKPSYNKPKRRNIYLFKKANWENIKEEIAKIGSTIINSTQSLGYYCILNLPCLVVVLRYLLL